MHIILYLYISNSVYEDYIVHCRVFKHVIVGEEISGLSGIPFDQEFQQMSRCAEVAEGDEECPQRLGVKRAVESVSLDDFEQSAAAQKRSLAAAII